MGELLKQDPGTDPFEVLDNLSDILVWTKTNEHVDVIDSHFARDDLNLVLHGNLTQNIPCPNSNWPAKTRLRYFGTQIR